MKTLFFNPILQGAVPMDGMVSQLVLIGALFAVFYFLLIRPQQKKQKEAQKMLEALKRGDKIETIGGIRGEIVEVKKDSLILKVDDNTKMEFLRTAIAGLQKNKADDSAKVEKETK